MVPGNILKEEGFPFSNVQSVRKFLYVRRNIFKKQNSVVKSQQSNYFTSPYVDSVENI